jgi:dTDP-4-amino-4,6-dideoxygalactose transaminase
MDKPIIPLFKVFMSDEAIGDAVRVLRSGYIGQGQEVEEFEKVLAARLSNNNIVTVNSGTSALHLALHLLKTTGIVGHNDEVLTTPLTCFATNAPILMEGLRLKWVDVDPATFNMSLSDLEDKLTEQTRVIVVVHWGGYPVDMVKLNAICDRAGDKYGFRPIIIQDCAHSWGTTCDGKVVSEHGDFSFYSLQAIKHINSIDGGVLVTPNSRFNDMARLCRWYGIDRDQERKDFRCEQDIVTYGTKWHMNDVSAAVGNANLTYLDEILAKHRSNANFYYDELKSSDVKLPPILEPSSNPAWWLFTLSVENRDDFMRAMTDRGVMTSRVHERNDRHSCVAEFEEELPGVDEATSKMICVPVGWWLTEEDRQHVVDCVKGGW